MHSLPHYVVCVCVCYILTTEGLILVCADIAVVESVAAEVIADTLSALSTPLKPARTLPTVL